MPNQREIFLAPFPFSDQDAEKQRPVLVVSNSVFNASGKDVIVMAVTSNLATPLDGVNIDAAHVDSGNLPRASRVLPTKVYSVAQARLRKYICRVNREPFDSAMAILNAALDNLS